MTTEFVQDLKSARLLGILRGCPDASVDAVADAVERSGLKFLEITMNTPGAPGQIERFVSRLNGICRVGAGTVLTEAEAKAAVEAGAAFLVSPCLCAPVQDFANVHGIPTLPGALTPTEIWNAHVAGAAMVKVFPARSVGGPAYFKELRGPFRDVPLLACGGVSAANAAEYVRDGADGLAFGGSVFTKDRLAKRDADAIAADIAALIAAVNDDN
ncbi:MAG TPA: 2-dehydro-3-deoxyphosphogluconate aldolase [Fibrobacteria bacterium]|nr:2-dehydro-3-deoxyphosphogluconate aldolase [Fibrobacteria bacterium]